MSGAIDISMAGSFHHPVLPLFFLLAMAASATKLADIDKPIPINRISIVAGYTARLECDLQSSRTDDSAYLVLWYIESEKQPIYSVDLRARSLDQAKHWKNERLASRAQFITTAPSTAAFLLSNVSVEDTNVYRCRVDFRHSPTRHIRYQLNVIHLPRTPIIYANGVRLVGPIAGPYDENTDLALICEVTGGGPDVSVSWYRNDKLIESRVEHRLHDYFYHLHLRSLSRIEHRAKYSCQLELDVQPPIPPVSRNVTLNIRLRPATVEITLPSPVLEATKSQVLNCRASGAYPPAVITWWIGNKQLTDAEISVSDEVNGTVSTLKLVPAMEDDGRIVTCRAQTPSLTGGFVEDSWRMQVHYPPKVNLVLGRRITVEEIKEGGDVYLECHVRASPNIHRLTWIHNGKALNDTSRGDRYAANQTLVIRKIDRHTAGNYTCVATNRQGEGVSAPLNLHVKFSPICRRSKPLVVIVSRDQPATLHCKVEADPDTVNFRWTLSTGRETALLSREVPSDNGLSSILEYTPRRDSEFGQLLCWAQNVIGKQKEPCVFSIVKEGLPPTPTQCVMHSLFKGVLEVKCRNSSAAAAASQLGLEGLDEEGDLSMSSSSNVYWLQLYNADTGVLLRNMSNKAAPHFNVSGVDPSTRVAAVITTTNRQGRSESVTLEGAVERAVGSRAVNEPESSMTLAVILATPGAILIAIIGLAAIFTIYHRQRKRNQPPTMTTASVTQPLQGNAEESSTSDDYHCTAPLQSTSKNSTLQKCGDGKQPDLIKAKRGFDYQVRTNPIIIRGNETPPVVHTSLVVVANGSSVQQQTVFEDQRDTCFQQQLHNKAGSILRIRHDNSNSDSDRQLQHETRERDAPTSCYVYR